MTYGIYNANYSELKGKESVSFQIIECEMIASAVIAKKGAEVKCFNILISDEDNADLCREEIRTFVAELNLNVLNISNKFPIK
jgi:hypothetical protein